MSVDEQMAEVVAARERALTARGGTDDLIYANLELGTINECSTFLKVATSFFEAAVAHYEADDISTGDLKFGAGTTWAVIAAGCLQAFHTD
jgi:hypothetical protein